MTKKDFEAIAGVIKEVRSLPTVQRNSDAQAGIDIVAARLSKACAEGNERFDRGRFLRACGIS